MSDIKRQVAFRLPASLLASVHAWSTRNGESPSWAARDLLRRGLLSLPPDDAPAAAPASAKRRASSKASKRRAR